MVKKALLVTTVSGFIPQFEMNNVRILQQMGYEVHYASNYNTPSYGKDNHRLDGTGIIRHQIDFVRSPYSLKNYIVYRQLKILMEKEKFQLIHCHTPMGGVMARLTAHATGTSSVIYTAHGFHFYKGAPLINWLCYYPMEKWLSRYTDQLLCINQEDYAQARKFHAKHVDYIPGVGIDLERVKCGAGIDLEEKKVELGIAPEQRVLLSAGELIKRKNHESIIRAIAEISDNSLVYVICGHGQLEPYLKGLVKELGIESKVIFAGYRLDIIEIYQMADLYVFPSYQEGLPMALLEAMACGLPVVCSDIRGSRDLMKKNEDVNEGGTWEWSDGGIMVKKADDVDAYVTAIKTFLQNPKKLNECGKNNMKKAEDYSIQRVEAQMKIVYERFAK